MQLVGSWLTRTLSLPRANVLLNKSPIMKKSNNFQKFSAKSNAAKKEHFKQEKRKWKKEREDFFDRKRSEAKGQNSEVKNSKSDLQPLISDLMPLNKFIAHCGVCSRRDAAELVKQGKVKVNHEAIMEPGHKVSARDEVVVNGKKISLAKNLVYILLNKPKDYITTTDDPEKRKTVLDLIRIKERIYPVGRLDRNTSGVLLLTNDGELSQKLTHPSHEVKKVYHVTLNRGLDKKDFDQILKGVSLDDGPATVDALAYADSRDKTQLGVEIHSGRNRIVRRIFEHLGYVVKNLDRVLFAGLTKKNVERGKWRFLSEKEIRALKFFDSRKSSPKKAQHSKE
jgi:23S rRNA pseudouridine2605 synthase